MRSRLLPIGRLLLLAVLLAVPLRALAGEVGEDQLLAPLSDGTHLDLGSLLSAADDLPSPQQFLGYSLGERFTPWHRVTAYLEALAAASDALETWSYGESCEGRPLVLLAASRPENLNRLEEIRQDQLRLANPDGLSGSERDALLERAPIIVWLGYGVHGNESSSTEAAMAVAYLLAQESGAVAELLRQAVVILDPLMNPDGRERYVQEYLQRRGLQPDPNPVAIEHQEPWPGGRFNHYLFDLNRDWAWASQPETRQRVAAYRRWEPQVFVDFHEMGSDSSYFFPPSAEPILPQIPDSTVGWLEVFGQSNAEAFDRQGWVYYKAETFDLFYPGYGDSYSSLRGAIGMTYEMAGGGRAGQAVQLEDGRELWLSDRIARHFTTSLATLRTAVQYREALLADFVNARLPVPERERSYLWSADDPESRPLAELLRLHGIAVQQLTRPLEASGIRLASGSGVMARERRNFPAGSFFVDTSQALGHLTEALLQLEAHLPASFLEQQQRRIDRNLEAEFYDVTAWSLPLAFGVEAWELEQPLLGAEDLAPLAPPAAGLRDGGRSGQLGFLLPPQGLASYRLAAALQEQGLLHRLATEELTLEGRTWPTGTLFIPRRGNPPDLGERLDRLSAQLGLTGQGIDSGFTSSGISLGSDLMLPVRPAHIGLLTPDAASPSAAGALWHLFDQVLELPYSRLGGEELEPATLGRFNVLVLPSGSYGDQWKEDDVRALERWIRGGGILVASGEAVDWLHEQKLLTLGLDQPAKPDAGGESEGMAAESTTPGQDRQLFVHGAAAATEWGSGHALSLGISSPPAVLVSGDRTLKASGDPRKDLLVAASPEPLLAGFAWPPARRRLAGSLLAGNEGLGEGQIVIFAGDPAFRGFWRATMPLLLNAVLYGPSLAAGGLLD